MYATKTVILPKKNYARRKKTKFEETGVIINIERSVHHRFAHSAENIAIVSESVAKDTNVSIPRCPQELGLSYGTLWRILHLDLHLHSAHAATETS